MAMLIGANSPTPGFTDRGKQAAAVLGPQVMLWLSSASPDNARQYPNCLHLVRLDNWQQGEGPLPYCARVEPTVTAWRGVPNVVFVLGNEPDREAGHLGQDFPLFAQNFRARFTGTKVANPPLSVDGYAALTQLTCDNADYVLCHSYWETFAPQDMSNAALGATYRHALSLAGSKPVIVSEINAVTTREGATIDWQRRNRQVAQWLDQAEADGVYAACLFILDGNSDPRWVKWDVGPEAAAEILSLRAAPVPVPHPTNSPLRFKGRSVSAIMQMIVDGSGNGISPFRETIPDIIAACQEWNLDEAALVAWTTAENNNATNISSSLLLAHNGAGIKYVGQPRAHSGADYNPPVLAPASEGGVPYCVFDTWADFFWVLARNIVTILPAAYEAGDLNRIAWYYTLGTAGLAHADAGEQHTKERLYEQFAAYPDNGPIPTPVPPTHFRIVTPVDCPVVQGSDGAFSHGGAVPGFFAIDYGCAVGTPVRASADGKVLYAYWQDSNPISLRTGHSLYIAHDNLYSTFSCHLSRFDVAEGDRVTQGQVIGLTGTPTDPGNGFGDGPHLHWEIWDGVWGDGGVRVKMETLETAGIAGPWDGTTPEEKDVTTDGKFDAGRIQRLWDGPKSKAQIKAMPRNPTFAIDARWEQELRAGHPLGFVVSKEEHDPATGIVIRYFSNAFIAFYPDGSTTVN